MEFQLFKIVKDSAVKVLHSTLLANLENPIVVTGLEKVSFRSNPKKGQCQRMSNYHTIVLVSYTGKGMLKILQISLQQYVNQELSPVQAGFWRNRGIRYQIVIICWIMEKAREFQKNIYFCFIDITEAFDCVDHNKPWEILKDRSTRSLHLFPEKTLFRSRSNS